MAQVMTEEAALVEVIAEMLSERLSHSRWENMGESAKDKFRDAARRALLLVAGHRFIL